MCRAPDDLCGRRGFSGRLVKCRVHGCNHISNDFQLTEREKESIGKHGVIDFLPVTPSQQHTANLLWTSGINGFPLSRFKPYLINNNHGRGDFSVGIGRMLLIFIELKRNWGKNSLDGFRLKHYIVGQ